MMAGGAELESPGARARAHDGRDSDVVEEMKAEVP